jgi:hypothetical protein
MKVVLFNIETSDFDEAEFEVQTAFPDGHPQMTNYADGDLFFIDLDKITGDFIKALHDNKEHIFNRVETGGVLICFSGKMHRDRSGLFNYNWLGRFGCHTLEGESFSFLEEPRYLPKLHQPQNSMKYPVVFDTNDDYIGIATNKSEKFTALYKSVGEGYIFILPPPTDFVKYINYFIATILPELGTNFDKDVSQVEEPPEYLADYQLPTETEHQDKIEKQKAVIEKEQKKLKEFENEKQRLVSYKGLLWQTGTALEDTVKHVFSLLGLELEQDDEMDLVGKYEGNEVFVEIKGKKGIINHKEDFRQIEERKVYKAQDQEKCCAILVGNAFRHEAPSNRPPEGQDNIFAPTSIEIADKLGIGLVSTVELYQIMFEVLSNPKTVDYQQILHDILFSHGIFSYKTSKDKKV